MVTTAERVYQQFDVRIMWTYDREWQDDDQPWQRRDLPVNRGRNSVQLEYMPKENVTLEQAEQWAADWWNRYEKKGENPALLRITVAYRRSEVWYYGAIHGHFTYDIGQTDDEALASFASFVDRMQTNEPFEYGGRGNTSTGYLLAGAEHRWRWHGKDHDDPPPCRCEHCKAAGVIRIGH